jgi:hypothetical protein
LHRKSKGDSPDLRSFISTCLIREADLKTVEEKPLTPTQCEQLQREVLDSLEIINKKKEGGLFQFLTFENLEIFLVKTRDLTTYNPDLQEYLHSKYIQDLKIDTFIFCWSCYATKEKRELSACKGCQKAHYCNRECQVKDWSASHKKECKSFAIKSKP